MKPSRLILRLYTSALRRGSGFLARRLRNNFYLLLASLFTLFALVDVVFLHSVLTMRHQAYDLAIRNRIIQPRADPDIVIVDINEASLSAMARDYGRWPWPRRILGEFVESIEKQKPRAVVFDILFSDPDVFNADSDLYFNDVIAATGNTFFPMLRLPEQHDASSQLRPSMVPGIRPAPGARPEERTIAMVLPFFKAALQGGRLGTHNIYPDTDGVARAYPVYQDAHGWRIPSLPARVAEAMGWAVPPRQDILLNWRGKPFSYRYVSFSDVYLDTLKKTRRRPADEFAGKIVIIGSTAPSLFDIKPTSMARLFPGAEILATAIDNIKHDDYIRAPDSRWPVLLAALLVLWGTALGFYKNVEADRFARVFGFSQIGLLGISYLTINLTNFYFNLAGPVLLAFAYFSVAKLYAFASAKALERNGVTRSLREGSSVVATMALFEFRSRDELALPAFLRDLKKAVEKTGTHDKDVEMLRGAQRGIWGVLDNLLVVSWIHATGDEAAARAIAREASDLVAAMPRLVEGARIAGEVLHDHTVHACGLGMSGAHPTEPEWRQLFAQTLEKMRNT